MPKPVSEARQCLTEEAARALDDAVAVARRRSHSQTTSLHAVSALLSLPTSTLRDACTRARSCAYSPRLQFRALDLSVGVSLDRLPSCKNLDEETPPPISNSLMAAIKRSQANQKRHPETFHLYQQAQNQFSLSNVKVELKHFILSILDDPIVSRVFGDAGFRSTDIKLAILQPPPPISRLSKNRFPPPLFLCNLPDSESSKGLGFNFPFAVEDCDENGRRIAEVLVKKKGRNPLLIGFCAKEVLKGFIESVKRGKTGNLPVEIQGLSVNCIEKEIYEFVSKDGGEDMMGFKFKELGDVVERCKGCGVIVNFGELDVLLNGSSVDSVNFVVARLSGLVEVYGERLWLMGSAGSDETYKKFVGRFPSIEKNWDLHLLPITSSTPANGGSYSKSSLLGSFVPFGGFFPTLSEFKNLASSRTRSISLCDLCNEKYEQEVSVISKGGSTISVADQHLPSLSSWLQKDEGDTCKSAGPLEAREGEVLNAQVMRLQRKWNDFCKRLHHPPSFPQDPLQVGPPVPAVGSFCSDTNRRGSIPLTLPNIFPPRQNIEEPVTSSVTTDLGLGSLYAFSEQERRSPKFQDPKDHLQKASGSVPTANNVGPTLGEHLDDKDFKYIWKVLADKVSWQEEAICTISQTVSTCRNGQRRLRGQTHKGDIWLSFLGPDKVGKRRVAAGLAEISRGELLSVNLNPVNWITPSNSIFDLQDLNNCAVGLRGKTIVEDIAEKLSRKNHSVVLLENIDKADFPTQHSLNQAIKAGRFPDSNGREISVNNVIFVTTTGNDCNFPSGKGSPEFPEERILGAKSLQMKIIVENFAGDLRRTKGPTVSLMLKKGTSDQASINKRKTSDIDNSLGIPKRDKKVSKTCIDLNIPVEEMEDDDYGTYESDSGSEPAEVWLEDFLDQVDQKVIFRSFDFDALSEKILKEIEKSFKKAVGTDIVLEIDPEVMVQILAASWLSNSKRAVEDWIEQILERSFVEAKQKNYLTVQSIVKLVALEGLLMEEQAPNVCLPANISVN